MPALANSPCGRAARVFLACLLAPLLLTPARTRSAEKGGGYSDAQKGWALGTCAVLTQVNEDSHRQLGGRPLTEENAKTIRRTLANWWDVHSREELLATLNWVDEQGGHRKEFDTLAAMSKERLDAAQSRSAGDAEAVNMIAVAREYGPVLGPKSLLAWDYARYVSLCGWGVVAGYLSDEEAWSHIMPVARKLQHTFGSWHDLGQDYLIGRRFWSLANTQKSGAKYTTAVEWLETSPESPWKQYPWDLNLDPAPASSPAASP